MEAKISINNPHSDDLGSSSTNEEEQRKMRAVILKTDYVYDDSVDSIPEWARGKTPERFKVQGVVPLKRGTQGLLASAQDGKKVPDPWAWAIFYGDGIPIRVLVPLRLLSVGVHWRPLHEKFANSTMSGAPVPNLVAWNTQADGTVLENYIRSFWRGVAAQPSHLRRLGFRQEDYDALLGGDNLSRSIEQIIRGFTPQAKQLLQDGKFVISDLAKLRRVTKDWPPLGNTGIYIRLYKITRTLKDGKSAQQSLLRLEWAIYGGQTKVSFYVRNRRHESDVEVKKMSCHYSIARKADISCRLMIPIILWNPEESSVLSAKLIDMAEQTVITMMNSYHNWCRTPNSGIMRDHETLHYSFRFIDAISNKAHVESGWPKLLHTGCNLQSPLFNNEMLKTIHSIPMPPPLPNIRSMTTYRRPCRLLLRGSPGRNLTGSINFRLLKTGQRIYSTFGIPSITVELNNLCHLMPVYLVFEIMDDDRPHAAPFIGCPKIGPFKNFNRASALGVRMEWYDEQTTKWLSLPIQQWNYRAHFTKGVQENDSRKAIKSWQKAMDIMQALKGIQYKEPLDGFQPFISLGKVEILELQVNHLQQTAKWVPRPVKPPQATPERASYLYNKNLTAEICRGLDGTVTNLPDRISHDSDFWTGTIGDRKAQSRIVYCDLCTYMRTQDDLRCVSDGMPGGEFICRSCFILDRPCTWTSRANRAAIGGIDRYEKKVSMIVGEAHRCLTFYNTLSPKLRAVEISAPLEGREGLIIFADCTEDEEDEADSNSVNIEEL